MFRHTCRIAIAVSVLVLLAACASSGGASYAQPKRLQAAAYEVDAERVALIEHVARQRGVDVHWVNKPTKPVQRSD